MRQPLQLSTPRKRQRHSHRPSASARHSAPQQPSRDAQRAQHAAAAQQQRGSPQHLPQSPKHSQSHKKSQKKRSQLRRSHRQKGAPRDSRAARLAPASPASTASTASVPSARTWCSAAMTTAIPHRKLKLQKPPPQRQRPPSSRFGGVYSAQARRQLPSSCMQLRPQLASSRVPAAGCGAESATRRGTHPRRAGLQADHAMSCAAAAAISSSWCPELPRQHAHRRSSRS